MEIKFHYDEEDDILTLYNPETAPTETIEFSEFLNIDINKDRGIVGLEIFYASEFLGLQNEKLNKEFLENLNNVSIECKEHRNCWFIVLILDNGREKIRNPLPPLRKSEYVSPLIAGC